MSSGQKKSCSRLSTPSSGQKNGTFGALHSAPEPMPPRFAFFVFFANGRTPGPPVCAQRGVHLRVAPNRRQHFHGDGRAGPVGHGRHPHAGRPPLLPLLGELGAEWAHGTWQARHSGWGENLPKGPTQHKWAASPDSKRGGCALARGVGPLAELVRPAQHLDPSTDPAQRR